MWDEFTDASDEPSTRIDTAQICLNGHVVNDSFEERQVHNKKHCTECGEPTIIACPECQSKIPGRIYYHNVIGSSYYVPPAFCPNCGKPYPWTLIKLKAAKELAAEIEGLSPEEQKTLEKSIDEISKNNPQASVGATRIKKIMSKVGTATGEILQKIITDVASETAKKILLGK